MSITIISVAGQLLLRNQNSLRIAEGVLIGGLYKYL